MSIRRATATCGFKVGTQPYAYYEVDLKLDGHALGRAQLVVPTS